MYCFNFFRNKLWRRLVSYNSFTFSCFLFPVGGGGSKRFEDWRGGEGVKNFRTWGLPVCGGTFAGGSVPHYKPWLLSSSNCLYMSQTFIPFGVSSKYFLTLFIIINGQPCCRIKLADPLFPSWSQSFEILVHYASNHPQNPQTRWWLADVSCNSGYSFLGRDWCQSLFYSIYHHRPLFSEKFVNFKFGQIFNSWYFSYSNDETRAQNPLISRPYQFHHTGLYCQNSYVSLLESKASEFESLHRHNSRMC